MKAITIPITWLIILCGFAMFSGDAEDNVQAEAHIHEPHSILLRVMSYNLRYASKDTPHPWEARRPIMRELLQRESPDVIGTQEGLYRQIKDIKADLPGYNWIGMGRKGGGGTTVFYKESRLKPLEYNYYWLSGTPEITRSKTWGNEIPRTVTWVRFLDRYTKQQFYLINTHFDHMSHEARVKSAELILERAADFSPALPVLLTGDFNASPGTKPYQILVREGNFADTWEEAPERVGAELGTFNNFKNRTGGGPQHRIDWIMVRGPVTTDKAEICHYDDLDRYPSDHFPVIADVNLESMPYTGPF